MFLENNPLVQVEKENAGTRSFGKINLNPRKKRRNYFADV